MPRPKDNNQHVLGSCAHLFQQCTSGVRVVREYTLITLVCNKFPLFLYNFTKVTYVVHQRRVEKHDLLFSSLKKVCYQVFLADTSEKSLFFMNIGA